VEEEWKSRALFFHPCLRSPQQNTVELLEANRNLVKRDAKSPGHVRAEGYRSAGWLCLARMKAVGRGGVSLIRQ
jgi:hypothetical protein